MAKLTKEQYSVRRERAVERNIHNEEIAVEAGMTKEQAELISELCSLRHEIHTNSESMYNTQSSDYDLWDELEDLMGKMRNAGLQQISVPPLEYFPCSEDRYVGIIDNTEEAEKENKEKFYDMMHNLNDTIEDYLRSIDKKYGTSFTPTGMLRLF